MVTKLLKYGIFAAMVAVWLVTQIRNRRAGIKPDQEKAKAILDKTIEGVFGSTDEEPKEKASE